MVHLVLSKQEMSAVHFALSSLKTTTFSIKD